MRGVRQLERAYDRLEPMERLRLTLAAEARDDDRDVEQLARTCPRHAYRICEREFLDPLELAAEVAVGFAAELLPLAARAAVVEAAREIATVHFARLADTVEFAESEAKASTAFRREVSEAIDVTRDRHLEFWARVDETLLAEGSTSAHGFAAFCRQELGVEPEILLGAYARVALPSYAYFVAHPGEADSVASYQAALIGAWRWRLGQQPEPTPVALHT